MKRLITLLAVAAFGIMIFAAPMVADPGVTTNTTSSTSTADSTWMSTGYPPPPDGYVGPWPPTDTTVTTTSGDGGDENPWIDPEE